MNATSAPRPAASTRRGVFRGFLAVVAAGALPPSAFATTTGGLDAAEAALIAAVADTLIPATDTPGALAVGVPRGFDGLMSGWASPARRTRVTAYLRQLSADLDARVGTRFTSAPAAARLKALAALDADAFGSGWSAGGDWRDLKALLVRLYYASEAGATVELRYEPIPGGYQGCVPFSEIGRSWAA